MARSLSQDSAVIRASRGRRRERLEPGFAVLVQLALFALGWALVAYGALRLA